MKDPLEEAGAEVDRRGATRILVLLVLALVALFALDAGARTAILLVVGIVVMVMLHEAGHYAMAKRSGMKVTEYFLGFGPRLWSFRRGETEYGVKAIPAGGYVRIIGMNNVDEVDPADEERTYRAKPYHQRLGVAVAGSAMHFLLAGLLLFVVYAAVGIPEARPVVNQIVKDSPAAESDFHLGDRIVAVNGQAVKTWEDIPRYVQSHGESQLVFTVARGGERLDISLKPRVVV